MVLANMTFEIWRKARSKRGGGVLGGRKEAELNMGEKVLKRSERNGKKARYCSLREFR